MCFDDGSPSSIVHIGGIVGGKNPVEGGVVSSFEPDAKMLEDSGLSFSTNELSKGGSLVGVVGGGEMFGTVLKKRIPYLFGILLDLSE